MNRARPGQVQVTQPGQGEERRGEERGELMIVVSPSLNFTILKFLLYYCSTCTRLGTTLGTTVTV